MVELSRDKVVVAGSLSGFQLQFVEPPNGPGVGRQEILIIIVSLHGNAGPTCHLGLQGDGDPSCPGIV